MLFLLDNTTKAVGPEEEPSPESGQPRDKCDDLSPGDGWACIDNVLQDEELINSMKLSSILGVCCFFLFGVLQTRFPLYKIRLYLPQVTVKPPRLPTRGFRVLWQWLYNIVFTSDQHLLASSGLDALILVKTMGFGVQLFLPLAVVAAVVLIPIHRKGDYGDTAAKELDAPAGRFMAMTMSNLKPGTSVYWVHFWCVYAFIGYALLLLFFQHKRFVRLRHHYLTSGDDPNMWRMKYQANTPRISTPSMMDGFTNDGQATSPVGKMRRMMKMVTGIGKDDMFEDFLKYEPQGLMGKAARVRMEVNKELLDTLQHRSASMATINETGETPRLDPPAHVQPRTVSASPNSTGSVPEIQIEEGSGIVPEPDSALAPKKKEKPKINISLSHVVNTFTNIRGNGEANPVIYKWWDIDFYGSDEDEELSPKVQRGAGQPALTARPSIRYLRTVNTEDPVMGEQVAVNAQQYCVLITDVPDVRKMIERKQKKETRRSKKKTKGRKVWEFLHTWVGGGMSLKTFHPSANAQAVEKRPAPDPLERGGILSLSMGLGDPLVEPTKSSQGSNWGKVAEKISSEEIFHLEEALVEDSFKILFPYDFVRAVPIRNHKAVDDLLLKLDNYQARLEKAEEYFHRTGKRATRWHWSFRNFAKIDELAACKLNISRLEREIGEAQKRIMREKPSPSWLLIFRTQHSATVAAQTLLHSESSHKFKASPAPGPEEMNWQALWKTWVEKDVRSVIIFPFLVFLCLLPIGLAMGAMSRLNNLLCGTPDGPFYWNAYCAKHGGKESQLRSLVTGWLPPILVSVWQNMIMPKSLYYLAQARATCISLSQLDREIACLFFYWDVFNIFIGAMMGGTLFSSEFFRTIKSVSSFVNLLGAAVPASANFFVNYITLRAFFLMPYQLLAPHPGIWLWLFKLGGKCGCARTKREKTVLYRPASIRFGREYGILLLIFLISLCYSIVAPIIVPITSLLFILSWVTWRYQVLYVFVRKYESGGRMWPVVFNRILYCLFLFQFFTSMVLLIKQAFPQAAILLITVPIILIRFRGYCNDRFRAGMEFIPLEMAFHSPPADIDPKVYTPPALIKGCAGWHPEYMKAWEGWGAPGYVV